MIGRGSNGHRKRESGAALLIVLVVLVTLSSIAILMSDNIRIVSYRTVAYENNAQAHHYAEGAEQLASVVLKAQSQQTPKVDHLNELWLREAYALPIEQGEVVIKLADATACFNVNSLVREDNGIFSANRAAIEEYNHLLTVLDIDARERTLLIDSLVDWLDSDSFSRPSGAEDLDYAGEPIPYRAGNTLISDISELRAMYWYTPEQYQLVKPYLCAAPDATPMAINLNTVTENQVPVLYAALGGAVTVDRLRNALENRGPEGFVSEQQFMDLVRINPEQVGNGDLRERLVLWSRFAMMEAKVKYEHAFVRQISYFEIDEEGLVRVNARQLGAY